MSGGGSKTETQTQTQTTQNEPYSAAKPLYNKAMGDALDLYKDGDLVNPLGMSTVVPYSEQTTQGLDFLEGQAQQNLGGSGLSGAYQGVIDSGGYNTQQGAAIDQLMPFASGDRNVDGSGFENMAAGDLGTSSLRQDALFGESWMPSHSEQNLSQVASGELLGGGDPYFEDALARASEEARFAADRSAAGMGRYGSDDHYGTVARDIADIQTTARSNQYNTERAAQERANQMLDSTRLSNMGLGLSAANAASGIDQSNRQMQASGISGMAGLDASNLSREMEGISQLFNAGQTGFGNLGSAYEGMQAPVSSLMNVGGAYEDLATRELNDELRIAQEEQNEDLSEIQALLAVAGGAGGYGTSYSTAQVPYQQQNNGFSNALGLGLGAASLFGGGGFF